MQNEQHVTAVKGTVKVGVLQNDPNIKDPVEISYYDPKPFYFLTTILKNTMLTTKEKRVFNPATNRMYPMNFLIPNFADEYNQNIDHVDMTDHLGNNYQLGRGLLQWILHLRGQTCNTIDMIDTRRRGVGRIFIFKI